MKLTKELYRGTPHADGNYPVMIRIYHAGAVRRVATQVSCSVADWNNSTQRIERTDPDHRRKNETVEACLRRLGGEIQDYIDSLLSDSLDEIILNFKKEDPDRESRVKGHPPSKSIRLFDIIQRKMDSLHTLNTRRNYSVLLRFCHIHFPENPPLEEITQGFADSFIQLLSNSYSDRPAKRFTLTANLKAAINYARHEGLFPIRPVIRFPNIFLNPRCRDISIADLRRIYSIFKETLRRDPSLYREPTLAISIFILDIAFQGIAPVDIAMLRCGGIRTSEIAVENQGLTPDPDKPPAKLRIIEIHTFRKKTGRPVGIIAWLDPIKQIIDALMKEKNTSDFLLPCFSSARTYTPEQLQNRQSNWFNKLARNLNSLLEEAYCAHGWGAPPHLTYYCARHAFCNLADSLDLPRHFIQILLGHKTTTLEKYYIRQLSPAEHAIASRAVFRLLEK